MKIRDPRERLQSEPALAYAAFLSYVENQDLNTAYNNYMQDNTGALTTFKGYVKWASKYSWQQRLNVINEETELSTTRETRRAGLGNALTAEEVASELYTTCLEEFKLHQSEMSHKDIGKYLDIAVKIGEKWKPEPAPVSVVVNNEVKTVDVSAETLKEIGRKMVADEDTI